MSSRSVDLLMTLADVANKCICSFDILGDEFKHPVIF